MNTSNVYSQSIVPRLAVLLLAAGEGSRLGSRPKILLKKDGKTLLELFSRTICHFSPIEFVMITGFHANVIEAEFERLKVEFSSPMRARRNNTPENGQASSVRLGLEVLDSEFDVLLIALSDQPEIGRYEIRQLLDEFSKRKLGEEIILPMVNGQRGNPVLFSKKVIQEILSIPGMNCRSFMDAYPGRVRSMQTNNLAFILDIDTLADVDLGKLTF